MNGDARKREQEMVVRLIRQRDRWRAIARDKSERVAYLEAEVRRMRADREYVIIP